MTTEISFGTGLVVAMLTGMFSVYVLYKNELHYHVLVVMIPTVLYMTRGIPQWLTIYENELEVMLLGLSALLIGRALNMLHSKDSGRPPGSQAGV